MSILFLTRSVFCWPSWPWNSPRFRSKGRRGAARFNGARGAQEGSERIEKDTCPNAQTSMTTPCGRTSNPPSNTPAAMYPIERHPQLDLANPIVDVTTSTRQMNTVSAILKQFDTFPGVILADEVGMGKTFVALGVAVSVALSPEVDQTVVSWCLLG